MHFFALGLNHRTAPIELRDAFSLREQDVRALYRSWTGTPAAEFVVLSTCNRTECYLHGTQEDVAAICRAFAGTAGQSWPEAQAFQLRDEEAVEHLLEVTAGLDSMVIGDAQILSQMKEAYRVAVEEERVGSILHRLMHTAFATAKRVMNETSIADGHASVAGTAASIARDALAGRLGVEGRASVLVVGAGQMGRLVVEALAGDERIELAVTNRTAGRLEPLIAQHPRVTAVPWAARYEALRNAQAVVVATNACEYVLTRKAVEPVRPDASPVVVIDIAMPRNVDPRIGEMPGFRVLDMDAIQHMIGDVIDRRRADLDAARDVCREMLADFVSWFFHHQALQPAIRAILETFDDIRRQEIERHQHRFSDVDYRQLDRITRSIMQKVLAVPVVRLKNVGPDHIDYVNGIKLLQLLFARTACEDPVATHLELDDTFLDMLAQPGEASLSTLAAVCPFDEGASVPRKGAAARVRSMPDRALILGTRKSALALWQANHVRAMLEAAGGRVELRKITTTGDRILDKPLAEIDGKSLFTRELDRAILDGRIDFAVHSLKDLPSDLPEGLVLAAITGRRTPYDVFVAHPSFAGSLEALPVGARIGTSSLRRAAQLKAWRPDLEVVPVRGNVDTRLAKLDKSDWHGIVLAEAGLMRLGLEGRIHSVFGPERMLPAVGQGALGIVCAKDNTGVHHLLRAVLDDADTATAVAAERAFLRCLEGSCRVPVGALAARDEAGRLVLEGFVGSVDGAVVLRDQEPVDPDSPEEAGIRLGSRLLEQGAAELLQVARSLR